MPSSPHIVSDVMSHTVAAVGRRAAFKEIVQLMQDWKVSALPVLEGEGRVVGVVSEADLCSLMADSEPTTRSGCSCVSRSGSLSRNSSLGSAAGG